MNASKPTRRPTRAFLFATVLVVSTALACRFGGQGRESPVATATPTMEPIPVSQAAADRLETKIQDQVINSETANFSVTITDEEATSFLALNGASLPLTDPQIHFGQGKVFISGETGLGISARLELVASVTLDDGRVIVHVEEASMGRLAVPASLLDQISTTINESIAEAENVVRVTSVEVSQGQITVQGTKGQGGNLPGHLAGR